MVTRRTSKAPSETQTEKPVRKPRAAKAAVKSVTTETAAKKPRVTKARAAQADTANPKVVKPSKLGIDAELRDHAEKLKAEAKTRSRKAAQTATEKASGLMDDVAATVHETAAAMDKRFGARYGDYARRAAESVSGAAASVREKDVEDLVAAARGFIKKNPVVAAGAAAAIGFAMVRLFRAQDTGTDDDMFDA
ncbi:MAG: hypothetical protein KGQ42_03420 [Alphaproteobacteria bacterium]|nr:hypothetical protein [Alphaproteobacteria bacterium]MDE2341478.1 hypothetical protein [Alphaproteobacteria bacterium]